MQKSVINETEVCYLALLPLEDNFFLFEVPYNIQIQGQYITFYRM